MDARFGQARASKWPKVTLGSATMSSTGDQIRRARDQRGHTRERVYADTGVSVSVQRRIETGNGGGPKSVAVLQQHFGLTDSSDPDAKPTPEDHLPKVSDASLLAEMMRRWHQMAAELERLRAKTAAPLGVTAPVPGHLLNGPVVRNAIADDSAGQTAESAK